MALSLEFFDSEDGQTGWVSLVLQIRTRADCSVSRISTAAASLREGALDHPSVRLI